MSNLFTLVLSVGTDKGGSLGWGCHTLRILKSWTSTTSSTSDGLSQNLEFRMTKTNSTERTPKNKI